MQVVKPEVARRATGRFRTPVYPSLLLQRVCLTVSMSNPEVSNGVIACAHFWHAPKQDISIAQLQREFK